MAHYIDGSIELTTEAVNTLDPEPSVEENLVSNDSSLLRDLGDVEYLIQEAAEVCLRGHNVVTADLNLLALKGTLAQFVLDHQPK